jgi:hypothetical protein
MTLDLSSGRKFNFREDVMWRRLLTVARKLDAATDCEVAFITLSQVQAAKGWLA